MDPSEYDTALRIGTLLAAALGLATIFLGPPSFTVVGIVLVILSAIAFLVVVRNFLVLRFSAEPTGQAE